MYASGYSEVSKYSPQTKKKMHYHSKGKSCGYYMRIVFFFSSLIQSLIIVSLVLFLIYGKDQDSASMSHIHDLEESFSRLSIENVALRQQRKNLTNLLNATLTEKARNDFDLHHLRAFSNTSTFILLDQEKRIGNCIEELKACKAREVFRNVTGSCPRLITPGTCNCERYAEHIKAKLDLVEANLTQTTQRVSREKEEITRERDHLNLEAINLRRMKFKAEKEVEFCRESCKRDFANSLNGISNVTKAFLQKIDSLFPSHIAFQLTCPKQREHLEQIRYNCTSLSREVEDKFQRYLDSVGSEMSIIHAENSRFKAENLRVSEDYRICSQNRTALIEKNKRSMEDLQQNHDQRLERELLQKKNLIGQLMLQNISVNVKEKEVEYMKEELKQLELTCKARTMINMGGLPGGPQAGSSANTGSWNILGGGSSSMGQFSRTGSGSTGSGYSKPASTGTGSTGSSFFNAGSGSSTGSGYNKPASTGTGSAGSSFFNAGSSSSTGSGYNKPASTGTLFPSGSGSSTGSGYNKPASTGTLFPSGSGSSTGSGYNKPASTGTGSAGSSLFSSSSGSSTGSGLNKPASTGTGSAGSSLFSSSSGSSTGSSYNKPASTGTGSAGSSLFSSSSGSSTGSGLNKPASTGTGSAGSSLFSSGSGGSTGSSLNKPASTGTGSSSTSVLSSGAGGSLGSGMNKPASGGGFFGSASSSSSVGSSGTSLNKPTLTGRSSSATESGGSSTSSSGTSAAKPSTNTRSSSSSGSTGTSSKGAFSWFLGGSSKKGTDSGKGPSARNSFGGYGVDGGRLQGQGGGPYNVIEHVQDLRRFIKSNEPQEKDLSTILG